MISIDTLAIGAPIAAFLILVPLGFAEYCWIERAKKREQVALAASEQLSGGSSAQSAAKPDSVPAINTQTAAE
jgi:hypothetical protein